jgi:hypothetical protein
MSNIFEVGVDLEASFTIKRIFFAPSRNLSKGFALIECSIAFIIVSVSSLISTLFGYIMSATFSSGIETVTSSLPYGIFISILSSYIEICTAKTQRTQRTKFFSVVSFICFIS